MTTITNFWLPGYVPTETQKLGQIFGTFTYTLVEFESHLELRLVNQWYFDYFFFHPVNVHVKTFPA